MHKNETLLLAKRIKMLRLEAGYTQKQLARKLDISRSCLSNYESDLRQPDSTTLLRLAEHFHVTADYLLGRCENRSIALTAHEIEASLSLSRRLQAFGTTLDITGFDADEKLAMLSYYEYIKCEEAKKASTA